MENHSFKFVLHFCCFQMISVISWQPNVHILYLFVTVERKFQNLFTQKDRHRASNQKVNKINNDDLYLLANDKLMLRERLIQINKKMCDHKQ